MVHVRKMQLWGGTIAVLAAFAVLGSVPTAAQAACGLPSVARMWKDGGCAGSYLSMFKNDSIPHFSTYLRPSGNAVPTRPRPSVPPATSPP